MEENARTLREVMRDKRVGVRRLSKGAPVAPRTIYGVERGSTPQVETIRKISRYLDVDPMEVSEFRAALEEEGLTELPPETSSRPKIPRRSVSLDSADFDFTLLGSPGPGSPVRVETGESRDWRGEARSEIARLMLDIGRVESAEVYRAVWGEEPPQA